MIKVCQTRRVWCETDHLSVQFTQKESEGRCGMKPQLTSDLKSHSLLDSQPYERQISTEI